ncbi:hypothetical protein BKA62DRAFT_758724 [Auriculariales sp. MPI-PUGE-AT-0066]|nr:hypothetical protein BKA62DRAFT_758724 [Auriculariales sp. MPI-PUGE-AT-0066]
MRSTLYTVFALAAVVFSHEQEPDMADLPQCVSSCFIATEAGTTCSSLAVGKPCFCPNEVYVLSARCLAACTPEEQRDALDFQITTCHSESAGPGAAGASTSLKNNNSAATSTNTDPPTTPKHSHAFPAKAIVGAVVGGVLLLTLVAFGIRRFLRSRRTAAAQQLLPLSVANGQSMDTTNQSQWPDVGEKPKAQQPVDVLRTSAGSGAGSSGDRAWTSGGMRGEQQQHMSRKHPGAPHAIIVSDSTIILDSLRHRKISQIAFDAERTLDDYSERDEPSLIRSALALAGLALAAAKTNVRGEEGRLEVYRDVRGTAAARRAAAALAGGGADGDGGEAGESATYVSFGKRLAGMQQTVRRGQGSYIPQARTNASCGARFGKHKTRTRPDATGTNGSPERANGSLKRPLAASYLAGFKGIVTLGGLNMVSVVITTVLGAHEPS